MLKDKISLLAKEIHSNVVENRRHLHANPELSFHEYQTSAYVAQKLDELGIQYQKMANTGLVAMIKGEKPSDAVVALRADMDALPIVEANEVPYKSKNAGVMHACGHDAHTSSLLGTAKILTELKNEFGGTIKLIFQPAEEKLPGGASMMIKEGVLENPKPDAVIGQHVMPLIEAGQVGFRSGKYMASTDEIYVTVHGKGGHGAQPQQNIDPVLITSHIIVALQQIISRVADPKTPSVLSFGKVIANGATNVIPNEVYLEGTFRTMDEDWRARAHEKMKKMAEGIAEAMGGSCDFNIVRGYPFLINEEKLTAEVRAYAEDYLGKENVLDLDIWMAAEDFAYYSQVSDACFYRLGTGNKERGITSSVHTPTFDVDEESLKLSTGLMAYIALKQLGN
ncbi:MAG: N-acyl-L-amino acid amidohydrolase [Sphingobacteriales bacterium 17-39-43]|uniref:M20 metallopeptidase family protein n=1 Tax=Daejeonella sp. TaxID=2805397 RepID=UPI000BD709B9|nr:M20 family metallopeptidase [Daejeonella sp.]MCF8453218.1 amidohydrolase [Pedobacter sp.]OYY06052.1 MAG: N-acyl-L-amino acid amidohydrolase [Sphingobacteriia bacterium 35-40-5]OYZ32384.1 MAG: N-acyl-L-amino acid amidohydrolase [Sphingobacteriales bacterium 16-39-50]OYZ59273.1 MAG: N-acyl-L-amino acid amidohydrolase [Sphingobacteriales bacterium 24-40-4]OZA25748.1 MAG: N-acyl-L-amino acid amidohydrolase [Sphingobacteriales bacterium 17-39-43]OZA61761.1 MAG: N-acyl-L-amino acid amidohydrolas